MKMTTYTIPNLFTDGNLEGLTYTTESTVEYKIGDTGGGPGFGSRWTIISVVKN